MPDKNITLSEMLTPVLNKTVQHYLTFTDQPPVSDTKEFTAYHNACKAALAHIILLNKLTKQSNQNEAQTSLLDLIAQAEKENENDNVTPDEFS
ncbi:MAG: hypothetical protein J6Y85_03630 [Alphaproteobacteria bacterium]|nr:hypothetical protein [Alphaproteobacteria bacterium]